MTLAVKAASRVLAVVALAGSLALSVACGGDKSTSSPGIAGSYTATTFLVTPTDQPTINVLTQGGTLSLVIASDFSTTGSLFLPPSVTGDVAFTASMDGTAEQVGTFVNFAQSADSFVRNVTWTASGKTLKVVNQAVNGATLTITLTRS